MISEAPWSARTCPHFPGNTLYIRRLPNVPVPQSSSVSGLTSQSGGDSAAGAFLQSGDKSPHSKTVRPRIAHESDGVIALPLWSARTCPRFPRNIRLSKRVQVADCRLKDSAEGCHWQADALVANEQFLKSGDKSPHSKA